MAKDQDSYSHSGVDYSKMDPVKLLAQSKAKSTAKNLKAFDAHEVVASRGESAYVWEEADSYRALVIEGLGTKNLIADEVRKLTGKTHYDAIAQDAIAMVVNDLIVVGALPQVVNAYFAVGNSDWLTDEVRAKDLINGWAKACDLAGAAWGGGETPTLKDIVEPQAIDLGGCAVGIIKDKNNLVLGDKLRAGDKVVLVESSGMHANGVTLIRSHAQKNPAIYAEKLPDGRLFGEALLTPTPIYVALVRSLQQAKIDLHYMVNITGHGWRKLMRANEAFTYSMDYLPEVQPEFAVIQKMSGVTEEEMYGNYNMGAGFALYVAAKDADKVVKTANQVGFKAWIAGDVEAGPKQVIIKSKKITFSEESLGVR